MPLSVRLDPRFHHACAAVSEEEALIEMRRGAKPSLTAARRQVDNVVGGPKKVKRRRTHKDELAVNRGQTFC